MKLPLSLVLPIASLSKGTRARRGALCRKYLVPLSRRGFGSQYPSRTLNSVMIRVCIGDECEPICVSIAAHLIDMAAPRDPPPFPPCDCVGTYPTRKLPQCSGLNVNDSAFRCVQAVFVVATRFKVA